MSRRGYRMVSTLTGAQHLESTITLAGTDRPVEYAGFVRRAFALLIDQAIVLLSQWILLIPAALSIVYDSGWGWAFFCLSFLCVFIMQYWIYTAFFEHSGWQATPGKFLVGLKVTDTKGNPLTFWKSSLRLLIQYVLLSIMIVVFLYAIASLAPLTHGALGKGHLGTTLAYFTALVAGYCYVLFSEKKQTLFDKAAGRLVVFQPGYANSQQMTSFECFKRSAAMLPQQAKAFFQVGKGSKGGLKFFIPASLAVAAYAWSFFAVFQIAQNILSVEREIAAHHDEDLEKPKVTLKNMESVYTTLQNGAAKLGLKDLETGLQSRAMLFNADGGRILIRANKYMDTGKFEFADRDVQKSMRNSRFVSDAAFRSMTFSTKARLEQLRGKQQEARQLSIRSLQANPYNLEAIRILKAADAILKTKDTGLYALATANPVDVVLSEDNFRGLGYYGDRLEPTYKSDEKSLGEKLAECNKVLKLMPNCTQALLVKAETLKSLSKAKEAEKVGLQAIASDNTYDEALTRYIENLDSLGAAEKVNKLRGLTKTSDTAYLHSKISSALHDQAIDIEDENKRRRVDEEALKEAEKAVQLDPNDRDYILSLAEALASMDRHEEAIDKYKKALTIKVPRDISDYHASDATIYSSMSVEYERMEKIPQSIEALDQAIASDPENASNYETKGDLLCKLERFEDAISSYDRAIAIKQELNNVVKDKAMDLFINVFVPKSTRKDASLSKITDEQIMTFYRKRGEAHEKLGNNKQALLDFEKTANSEYTDGDKKIAHLYCVLDMPEKALATYTHSISKKPEDSLGYLRRAAMLVSLGKNDEAQKDRIKAVKVAEKRIAKDKSAENYIAAAEAYFAVGDYAKAHQYIDKQVALDGGDDKVSIAKAQVYAAQKNYPAALKIANVAFAGEKDCRCKAAQRGDVFLSCGQFKQAEKMFSDAIDEDAGDSKAYMQRSTARRKLGMKDRAAADLVKAKELGYDKDPVLQLPEF